MSRLSGAVFVLVGLVVAGLSLILIRRGQKMHLFLIAGLAMAVFGAWRLFVDKSDPQEKPKNSRHSQRESLQRVLDEEFAQKRSLNQLPRVCARCSTKNNPRANFCGNCGAQLT